MRTTPKYRARPAFKPRTRFAMKAKPRLRREATWKIATAKGGPIRGNSLGKIQETAAAGHKAGRRVKPKRETPRVIHPERSGSGHKRERLHGKTKTLRRMEIFERSKGRCEAEETLTVAGITDTLRCYRRINSDTYDPSYNPRGMEWSHNRHAANKCDCMACGIASCHDCHVKRHAGGNGKPCPKKEKALYSLKQAT